LLGTFLDCGLIRSPAGPIVAGPLRSLGLAVVLVPFTSFIRLLDLMTDLLPVVLPPVVEALPRADVCLILALPFGFVVDPVLLGLTFALVGFSGLVLESLRLCMNFCFGVLGASGFKLPALLPFLKDLTSLDTVLRVFLAAGFFLASAFFLAAGFLASAFF